MPPAAGQATLFPDLKRFPQTRYQGSKRKLAGAIVHQVSGLSFTTVLDAFGGTGAVSHAFKCEGKHVTYNDILSFNHQIGTALIENDTTRLTDEDIAAVGARHSGVSYDDFIARMFDGIYFTPEENGWLDVAVANIGRIPNRFKRSLAWFALCQAAMAKRPYNLFHRRNLYMRTADVPRGFGNKSSWDRSFPDHFRRFAHEANGAVVDGQGRCRAICGDAMDVEPGYDLVYVDPPYVNANGVGVDYRDFYHFLEGMLHYDRWSAMIDLQSKHRRVIRQRNPWCDAACCHAMFRRLFDRFRDSILVVSYRSDGIPSVDELVTMLRAVKKDVRVITGERYQY
ncbi:MAG: DNA adenine methylase, partial [Phycisphaerae bacterium]